MTQPPLILASTSRYRASLLERLQIPFATAAPDVDETPLPGEELTATAIRLAEAKARAVASRFPNALIIGSDQIAILDGKAVGKPGSHEKAVAQLRAMSGKTVVFHTALCLLDSANDRIRQRTVPMEVVFRQLSDEQIERYLRREQPYDCAGSAKSEGLGITLIAAMRGDDPNALIGLPLIALCDLLNEAGYPVI